MVHRLTPRRPGESVFPDDLVPDASGLVALGGDLAPETLVEAYAKGIFPWSDEPPIPWFSTDPRLVLLPGRVHVSRSLARTIRRGRYEVHFDRDFAGTIRACAEIRRRHESGTWIGPRIVEAYTRLFELGIGHSIETYRDGELVGGLYGLALGAAFFGESMFARAPDASKVALVALCRRLEAEGFLFLDCQQVTGHMLRMGAVPITRSLYLELLARALEVPTRRGSWRGPPVTG